MSVLDYFMIPIELIKPQSGHCIHTIWKLCSAGKLYLTHRTPRSCTSFLLHEKVNSKEVNKNPPPAPTLRMSLSTQN